MQQKVIVRREPKADPLAGLSHLHPILQRVYATRGIESASDLDYGLGNLLKPDLKGLDDAVSMLCEALEPQKLIVIVGDFDADGATSTALALRCLRELGFKRVDFLVPNRFEYGYGLTPEIVDVASRLSPDILLTVDNGIASHEGVARARALGIDVLITDHHLPGESVPPARAIVNPNQPGCTFSAKGTAGVGVVFYLMMALRAALRVQGCFETKAEPNLARYLDLVALGTVADVVPLERNNRVLVAQGLRRMQAGKACAGIRALMQVSGKDIRSIKATDLGFIVGPRLNAAGRLDDMSIGIRCLLTDDDGEALALAAELDALNRDRRAIESSMQKEAQELLAKQLLTDENDLPPALVLFQDSWHQGVIGILASRIKEQFHRPVIVFAEDTEAVLKGSGRSIAGVHLRDVLDAVATTHPGLLTKFGGHAMAAGLSLAKSDLERFKSAFEAAVLAVTGPNGIRPVVESDGALEPEDFTVKLASAIESEGPWGQAFPEPVFDGDFNLVQQRIVGHKHLKMVLSPLHSPDQLVDAIAFNVDLQAWPNLNCSTVRCAFKLSVNEFRGQTHCQMMVEFISPLAQG